MADSYLTASSNAAGAVADQAADRKCLNYTELSATCEIQPVAVETHGPLSVSCVSFIVDLSRKISERTDEPLELHFYSSGSASWFKGLTQSSFTRLSQLRTTLTRSHSSRLFLSLFSTHRILTSWKYYFKIKIIIICIHPELTNNKNMIIIVIIIIIII